MSKERWELSALERLVQEGTDEDIRRFALLLRPPELADFIERVPEEERLRILRVMSKPLASDVLTEVEEAELEEIIEDLTSAELAELLPHMMSDDAADIVAALPPDKAERTLGKLEADEREELEELLQYGEETAGGIMQSEVVTVPASATVAEAIETVRESDVEDVGEIHEVFAVDAQGRLVGSVSPADLLHAEPDARVHDVAERDPVAVPVTMDQEELARKAREHDLATIPVVDETGVLVGQVLHDDIADVLQEEATEDIAKMAGTDPEEVYSDDLWRAVRSRILWLIPAFLGGILVALLLGDAEEDIRKAPILAACLVVVVGMAGGVGIQNAALTVRSLALGRLDPARAGKVVARQLLTGVILGLVFGLALFGYVMLAKSGAEEAWKTSASLGVAMFTAIFVGSSLGVLVPLLVQRFGWDPAIAASPFIQTANDVVGAGILIWVARLLGIL